MVIIVPGEKSCLYFHKDLYSDLCLFNRFHCDLFLIMKETSFASSADENTPYVTAENLDEVVKSLEEDSIKLFQ